MTNFFFWFWEGDQHLAVQLVEDLHCIHPNDDCGVIALADGPVSQRVITQLSNLDCLVIPGPHLKQPGKIEEYLYRGFSYLLMASEAQHFILVDPDSQIRHAPHIPERVDWAGQIFYDQNAQTLSTSGAGAFFSRKLLAELVAYLPTAERTDFRYQKGASDDSTLGYHLAKLGYFPTPWASPSGFPEVELPLEWHPGLETGNFAITHPRKTK